MFHFPKNFQKSDNSRVSKGAYMKKSAENGLSKISYHYQTLSFYLFSAKKVLSPVLNHP